MTRPLPSSGFAASQAQMLYERALAGRKAVLIS